MTVKTVRKYARNVNAQKNPNLTKREDWSNTANSVGHTDLYATSHYTMKDVSYKKSNGKKATETVLNYPYMLTARDFGFELPSGAYIKQIKIGVCMKSSTILGCSFPAVGYYIKDRHSNVTDSKKENGWHNGIYWGISDKHTSTIWHTETYTMNRTNYAKGKFSVSNLNSSYFGVDLNFSEDMFVPQTAYLRWVWCEITYEEPNYVLVHGGSNTTQNNPRSISTGLNYITYHLSQPSNANGGNQTFTLKLPFGCESEGITASRGTVRSTSDPSVYTWTVNCPAKSKAVLTVHFVDYTVNTDKISLTGVVSKDFWFKSVKGEFEDYAQTVLSHDNPDGLAPHKGHKTCFKVFALATSDDDTLTIHITQDNPFVLINTITVNEGDSDNGVSLNHTNIEEVQEDCQVIEYKADQFMYLHYLRGGSVIDVQFNVPEGEGADSDGSNFNLAFNFCLIPLSEGSTTLDVYSDNNGDSLTYTVKPSYSYHIGATDNETDTEYHQLLLTEQVNFTNHRIASTLTTGAYVLPCRSKEGDALMTELKPNIHMYKWEQIDYIGCVPVEHHHFDPKSTYKDKLLDSHYKNKRYMGKELASDEDIDLNIRLHPHQVTTIQGLIDMDKPIPINANHLCFESDALNHRGWAEIYGITTEETNPHWYKCSIDVKYLTHNLNTRFNIRRGSRTFSQYGMPELFAESTSSGDEIDDDYFIIDTDGTYLYVEDELSYEPFYDENGDTVTWNGDNTTLTVGDVTYEGDEILEYLSSLNYDIKDVEVGQVIEVLEYFSIDNNQKNQFSISDGEHIYIRSKNKLNTLNQITLDWTSNILTELKENAVSRIVRLVDNDGNSVFEYEYTDFNFNETSITDLEDWSSVSYISCRVIGRQRDRADFKEVINKEIDLIVDVEEDTPTYFGSVIHFIRNGNTLRVKDEGFSGSEIDTTLTDLEGNDYYYECYWENRNTDAESDDVEGYFDIVAMDNILDTEFENEYDKLYISPFPVQGKEVLFTRNAEEGVIYYLKDNEEEFTYLIEPYYQYHNGVDLQNDSHSSIFNLNYGYKVVYLVNGLVSLGINRLTGAMYLNRWDSSIQDYIEVARLQLSKYDDVNINSISDDRIELQASDTTIIMYRGHPYVIFKHELESIGLESTFHKVWGQKLDGGAVNQYPVMYDLMNTNNLLPSCVTDKLDDDCVTLTTPTVTNLESSSIDDITCDSETIYINTETTFHVSSTPSGTIYYLVDYDGDDTTGFDVKGSTSNGTFTYTFDKEGVYRLIAVYTGDDTHEYCISKELTVSVMQVPVTPTPTPTPVPQTGTWKLTMNAPSTMTYDDGSEVTFKLTRGNQPVNGVELEVVDFNIVNTQTTGDTSKGWADGVVKIKNRHSTSHPKTYNIGARFYQSGKLVAKVFKKVKVKKAESEFVVLRKAGTKGGKFKIRLRDKNTHRSLANKKITVKINKKSKNRKTDDDGVEEFEINKTGKYKYICVFKGDKDYKGCKKKYRESVKNG